MSARPGTRSFYLDDHADEVVPCDCTLKGWAEWLSKPDPNWEHEIPNDGDTFAGSATLWKPDINATCRDGEWSLSRDPDPDDFLAVRFRQGAGWDCDSIVGDKLELLDLLSDFAADDGTEYVACGEYESGWRFTYRANPPRLEAERVQ